MVASRVMPYTFALEHRFFSGRVWVEEGPPDIVTFTAYNTKKDNINNQVEKQHTMNKTELILIY